MKNDYEVRGDKVAIFLNRRDGVNLETLISLSDLQKVKSFPGKWYATTKKTLSGYYVNGILTENQQTKTIYLHRYLLEAPKGLVVDHINHNTLDNTRENLRVLTHAENHQNRKNAHKRNNSGVRGVYWNKRCQKWASVVRVDGKTKFHRFFEEKEDAVEAVKKARKVYMPFSKEALNYASQNYSEEDLLREYVPYQHDKQISNKKTKSGFRGVYWNKKRERWDCYLIMLDKRKYLGSFKCKQIAINTVRKAMNENFGR